MPLCLNERDLSEKKRKNLKRKYLMQIENSILNPEAAEASYIGRRLDMLKTVIFDVREYRHEVNLLLYLASENNNAEVFNEILNKEGADGIVLDGAIELYSNGVDKVSLHRGKTEVSYPFITQNPELLDKMAEKGYAVKEQCCRAPDACREVIIHGRACTTDAPDFYLAVLCGNVNMVRYFTERGEPLEVPYRMDQLNVDWDQMDEWRNGIRSYEEGCYFGRCMFRIGTEIQYDTEYIQEGGFYIAAAREILEGPGQFVLFFHDIFTAAVLSQNTEMIAWAYSMLPEIRWSRSLESAIAFSNKKVTEYMLKCYPEILDYMKLSSVYEGKNIPLLKAFAERHPNNAEFAAELERYLEWNSRILAGFLSPEICFRWDGLNRAVEFYKALLNYVRTESIVVGIRREIFHMLLSESADIYHNRKKRKSEKWREKIISFFDEIDPGICEDYTREFIDHNNCCHVIELLGEKKKGQFLSIDIYQAFSGLYNWGSLKWEMNNKETVPDSLLTLMKYVKPKEVREELDSVTKKLLDRNSVKFIRLAQKRGYINCKNALALYEYALKNPKCEEEILLILLRLSGTMKIEERFAESES